MKKIVILLSLVLITSVGYAQVPAGFASPKSNGFASYGYLKTDSAGIAALRDTSFNPKYAGTWVYWQNSGVDSAFWVFNGKTTGRKWQKVVMVSSSTGGYVLYTDTSAMLSGYKTYYPRAAISGSAVTGIIYNNNTGLVSADTVVLATRLRVQKGIDSLGQLKKNISDTGFVGGYTTRERTKQQIDSLGSVVSSKLSYADTGRTTIALATGGSLNKVKDSLTALISAGGFGTVLSVATTDGVGIVSSVSSPTANPNISIRVDTNTIATRLRVQKGIDSLGVIISTGDAAKLNISDTAAMLTPNYRRTITKITNSDLVNSTISGTALGSNLPALSFGTYLQSGALSYNGTTANTITTNATSSNLGSTLIARDINGDFAARNISASLVGNASSASTVSVTNDNTTNATMYPLWSAASSGNNSPKVSSSKITFNPNTGVLTSNFTGALTGNATTASTLQTPRTINGVAFDGSANISISASVDSSLSAGYGITGSPFNGSLGRTWVVDTTKIIPYTDTLASYGIASKSFVRSFGYGTGSVTSVATNNASGITGGTITTTGTLAIDTSIIATRLRVQKGIDSLGAITSSITSKTGILWGNGTSVNGSLYTFANDSVITFRGTKFLQNVSTTQNPSIYSLFLGFGAGGNFMSGTKGYANTAIGYYAGGALQSNVTSEASSNTLVGYYAGAGITTGTANTSLGTAALGSPNANKTVAIGWHAMESATNGDNAVAIGSLSMQYNTSLSEHVAVGASSLRNNTSGLRNTAIGYNTLNANTTGSYNTALGWDAMGDDAVGNYNTVLGYNAGNTLFAGSNNTIIGARVSPGSVNNSVVIGNGNGTIKALHNNSSWDLYDTVKASAFQSTGGIVTNGVSYIKGNNISAIFQNTGAGNLNSWQLLGGSIGSTYNWEFSKDNAIANAFEIAPSTAVGGTSFAASVFRLKNNGDLTISGNQTASSFVKSGGTSSQYLMADGSTSTLSGTYKLANDSSYNTGYTSRVQTKRVIDSVAALIPSVSGYKLISDTLFNGGYTTRNTTKKIADSLGVIKQPLFTQGLSGYIPKWTSASGLDTSSIRQIGSSINMTGRLNVAGATDNSSYQLNVSGSANVSGNAEFGTYLGSNIFSFERYSSGYPYVIIRGGKANNASGVGLNFQVRDPSGVEQDGLNILSSGVINTFSRLNVNAAIDNASYSINSIGGINNTTGNNSFNSTSGISTFGSRVNINGAADNSLFSLNNGGGTTYTNGFSPNASNYTGAITLGGGTTYVYTGSGAVTWTLPTPSSNNQIYIIKNNGSGAITLNAYSANQLISLSSVASSSMIIPIGETVTIQQDGSNKSYVVNVGGGSGTYTPTITNLGNVSSSSIPYVSYYSKVGNIVTVSGIIDVTPTASATTTSLRLTLPIDIGTASASKFISGVATSTNNGAVLGTFGGSYLYPTLTFVSIGTIINEFNFTFTYEVQ